MPTLTNPQTKDPLNALILQPGIAIEHLVKQGVHMPVVDTVELPDPTENRVVVTYSSYGAQESQTVEMTLEDFVRPFMQLRLTKAQDYDCEPVGEDVIDIVGRFSPDSRYRVERRLEDDRIQLYCPCQHAETQRQILPAFPVLWSMFGLQAHCKHTVKAALEWQLDLDIFRLLVD